LPLAPLVAELPLAWVPLALPLLLLRFELVAATTFLPLQKSSNFCKVLAYAHNEMR
jgi:hypothetical protein